MPGRAHEACDWKEKDFQDVFKIVSPFISSWAPACEETAITCIENTVWKLHVSPDSKERNYWWHTHVNCCFSCRWITIYSGKDQWSKRSAWLWPSALTHQPSFTQTELHLLQCCQFTHEPPQVIVLLCVFLLCQWTLSMLSSFLSVNDFNATGQK